MKSRFCKYCGAELTEEKICTGCGKKYFKIKPLKFMCIIELIIIALLITWGTITTVRLNDYKSEYPKSEFEDMENKYHAISSEYEELENKYNEITRLAEEHLNLSYDYEANLRVYQNKFAYYTMQGECYHKYDCEYLGNGDRYGALINELKNWGYRKCSFCY